MINVVGAALCGAVGYLFGLGGVAGFAVGFGWCLVLLARRRG